MMRLICDLYVLACRLTGRQRLSSHSRRGRRLSLTHQDEVRRSGRALRLPVKYNAVEAGGRSTLN